MESIVTIILGVVFIVIGISNRKGNISTLHSYHRNRVSEENRIPFGKLVGLGTIIIGISLILFGGLKYLSETLKNDIFSMIANFVFVPGMVAGLGFSFYAMKKYNNGIF